MFNLMGFSKLNLKILSIGLSQCKEKKPIVIIVLTIIEILNLWDEHRVISFGGL